MNKTSKMTIAGAIMGFIGIIISIEFLAVDAILFNVQPPEWIIRLSSYLPLNGLDLDFLFLDVLLYRIELPGRIRKITILSVNHIGYSFNHLLPAR